jgi:hypothetical protein
MSLRTAPDAPMRDTEGPAVAPSRITVADIATDLAIGRHSVYAMLEGGIIPGIKLKRGWLVTRHAYERWKETAGTRITPKAA